MCCLSKPVYSPLCDGDSVAFREYCVLYREYLCATRDVGCRVDVGCGGRVHGGALGYVGDSGVGRAIAGASHVDAGGVRAECSSGVDVEGGVAGVGRSREVDGCVAQGGARGCGDDFKRGGLHGSEDSGKDAGSRVGAEVVGGADGSVIVGGSPVVIGKEKGKHYEKNKAKRVRAKQLKVQALGVRTESADGGGVSTVKPDGELDWRQKGGVGVHRGVFSGCSEETQVGLRESRARMLIARNNAAAVDAEKQQRFSEAKLKSRMIEEDVERARLELQKKMVELRGSTEDSIVGGFAETIASALSAPSLSDGSVSPDSSVSVAELHRKDQAIRMLVKDREEADQRIKALEAKFVELQLSRKVDETRFPRFHGGEPKKKQYGGAGYSSWERDGDEFDYRTSCMN